jgi:hypothetical protein
MVTSNSARSLRRSDLRVNAEDHPGWVPAGSRSPTVGEPVYCTGGEGIVISLHGKTGDGSRLVQIRLVDEKAPPFFAAASNLLLPPE